MKTLILKLLLILLSLPLVAQDKIDQRESTIKQYNYKTLLAKSMPDGILKQFVARVTKDMNNVAKAALVASNGSLSDKVEKVIIKSQEECRQKSDKINIEEYRKAFDNSLSGRPQNQILTPMLQAGMTECLEFTSKAIVAVDPNVSIPNIYMSDFAKVLSDPKVLGELKKIDPNNVFIAIAKKNNDKKITPERRKSFYELEQEKVVGKQQNNKQDYEVQVRKEDTSLINNPESMSHVNSDKKKNKFFFFLIGFLIMAFFYIKYK